MRAVSLAVFVSLTGTIVACGNDADQRPEEESAATVADPLESTNELAKVRAATAKYHDVNVALADGYVPDPFLGCVVLPSGGMGYHYFNMALVNAPPQPERPGMLLYEDTDDGGLRLTGVEYFMPVFVNGAPWFMPANVPPPEGQYNPAPTQFGDTFDGPMPGHNPMMPWHYDQHVWIWKNNPAGMFSDTNPNVSCDRARCVNGVCK